jgi:hypothetical protein
MTSIVTIPYYVYKITFVVTGQYYYGSRYGHVTRKRSPEDDLGVYYQSSSDQVKDLIQLHGLDNIQFEIVARDLDTSVIFWTEQKLIQQHIADELCLNIWYQDPSTGSNKFLITGLSFWSKDGLVVKSYQSPGDGWIKQSWRWWTKDGKWKKAVHSPAEGWQIANPRRGFKWWNNGIACRLAHIKPGPEWKQGHLNANTIWWTDGEQFKRSKSSPGPNWTQGSPNKHKVCWYKDGLGMVGFKITKIKVNNGGQMV